MLTIIKDVNLLGISISSLVIGDHQQVLVYAIIFTLLISLNFHLVCFYKHYNESKADKHPLVAQNESARFESLKNQIDPHFLFNSLNVLTSLISENSNLAEKFTTKLS